MLAPSPAGFRRLWPLLKPHRRRLLAGGLCMLVFVACWPLLAWLAQWPAVRNVVQPLQDAWHSAGALGPLALVLLAGWAGVTAEQKATQLQIAADKVIWATYNHLGVQLFISNLKPALRDELMKAPPTDLNAAIKAARQLEKIHAKPENGHATVSEIGQSNPQAAADDVDQQIEALSAQFQALLKRRQANNGRGGRGGRGRGTQGRGGRGRGRGQTQGNNGTSSSSYNTCRYCCCCHDSENNRRGERAVI